MDPTKAPPAPPGEPGHYGPGYGEVPPPGSTPDPEVALPPGATSEALGIGTPLVLDSAGETASTAAERERKRGERKNERAESANSEGERVDFTAADVTARPPDRPPTESAPESEKVGLLFERS